MRSETMSQKVRFVQQESHGSKLRSETQTLRSLCKWIVQPESGEMNSRNSQMPFYENALKLLLLHVPPRRHFAWVGVVGASRKAYNR